MAGSFQPARLDVDRSLLDSQLSIVDPGDTVEDIFNQMTSAAQPKEMQSLLPEAEYPSVLAHPKQGLCVKTRNAKGSKFFINLCRLEEIPPPTPISETELERVIADEDYTTLWRVPMSIGAPRTTKDKAGAECLAADVALNSTWFKETMEPSEVFTTFVLTVAMEGLGDKYGEEARLDRDGWTVLKNKKYMGTDIPPHRIQKRASAGIHQIQSQSRKGPLIEEQVASPVPDKIEEIKTPAFKIEKDRVVCPRELTASVYLPGTRNRNRINLDIGGDRLLVECEDTNHLLDIFLPYSLQPDTSSASFNPSNQILTVKIPVEAT